MLVSPCTVAAHATCHAATRNCTLLHPCRWSRRHTLLPVVLPITGVTIIVLLLLAPPLDHGCLHHCVTVSGASVVLRSLVTLLHCHCVAVASPSQLPPSCRWCRRHIPLLMLPLCHRHWCCCCVVVVVTGAAIIS